jgi:HSP20 family protein
MRITTDPTRELAFLQGDVNRVFERFFGPQGGGSQTQAFAPALDIVELADRFELHMDLPGVEDDDVELEIEDRVLRVSGERRDTRESTDDGYRRIERSFGRFERVLTLPRGVDADAVEARFDRGVLAITVPKPAAARPRRIDITTGAGDSRPAQIEGREAVDERHLTNA